MQGIRCNYDVAVPAGNITDVRLLRHSCSVILDETFPKWESDKYNCGPTSSEDFMQAQPARGYGLGTFGSLQPPEAMVDEDMADDAAISSQPEPLIPYGGLNKYYLPPSPLKTKPAPKSASKAEASPTEPCHSLPFALRGKRVGRLYPQTAALLLICSSWRMLLVHSKFHAACPNAGKTLFCGIPHRMDSSQKRASHARWTSF